MIIKIGEETRTRMKLLGIEEYPFSTNLLKNKYRSLIIINHPDKGGNEDIVNRDDPYVCCTF